MSAYVVDAETINKIVTHIQGSEHADSYAYILSSAGIDMRGRTPCQKLGTALLALNVRSVSERYNETEPMPAYRYNPSVGSAVAALKALRCWRYQSCEGTCNESPLFQAMTQIGDHMAMDIISRLPEYAAAPWG